MSKSNGYYSRFYEMGTYSFTPMEEVFITGVWYAHLYRCLLYTSPSPRDRG